jgi:hypothetical protein
MAARTIHFVFTRCAMQTACGMYRASRPDLRGRAHIAHVVARVTCPLAYA